MRYFDALLANPLPIGKRLSGAKERLGVKEWMLTHPLFDSQPLNVDYLLGKAGGDRIWQSSD